MGGEHMDDKNLSFKEFLGWIGNYEFIRMHDHYKFEYITEKLQEYIHQESVKLFYPKNLFVEEKETELYLFTEDKLFIVTGEEQRSNFNVLSLKEIDDINFETTFLTGKALIKINIMFKNGREIVFNSLEDTNQSWSYAFSKKINNLFLLLIK
jgi:hypothetical protein